jgi:hypothetical protein
MSLSFLMEANLAVSAMLLKNKIQKLRLLCPGGWTLTNEALILHRQRSDLPHLD